LFLRPIHAMAEVIILRLVNERILNSKIYMDHVSDDAGRGAYIDGIQKGDEVSVYIRKWYQYILTFGAGKDIYGLEKDSVSYYDIYRWKNSNVAFMIIFSFFSLFFIALYVLQRVTVNELIKGKKAE